ncbi:nucleotidyltransferase domain-containing protein [Carboxydochorda subterranea]|uniref:Nucleotidyltransferase domain-containing protein n=1 Tax=Carboxydichorda subterranea TaxID=3109565 RepID=A0ABZ1BTU3_9FIRM|nr:nucleotidyltransferase domain-containing protein [Limnochorda sp. L945t]WRP16209.1 nucleotidyltransferase domain-containing protein [Limnochorda sp. L945t]
MRGWRRRAAQEEAALQKRAAEARSSLPALVETLRRYGATEVYVFGSLREGYFHLASDIDLGVRGIPPERFYAALAALDAVCDIPVDVVDLDEAPPSLRRHVIEKGQRLL